ncbi:MAG: LCP family protein [Candidatus Eremiobacteraeota bacterium]|nr:LCP family protein [Candidatus Eremiobacteraeota bacterium]
MAAPVEKPPGGGLLRTVLTALGIALVLLAAIVGGIALVRHQNPFEVLVQPIAPPPEQVFGKDHLLILAVGLDYDYNSKDLEYSTQARSDVIKAINLDFVTHRAYVLSIPRDMDAMLPNGKEAKINQAQSDGGIAESQTVIAQWLGIPRFDKYVILRIDTLKDLINAVGGVDVKVMNSDALKHQGPNGPIDYDDNWGHLHIHLKPGLQHLNGENAVGYARFRHDWCSDPCRIMRQDQVMNAIVSRMKNDKLNTLVHINQLIGVFSRDVETNLTTGEELSLAYAFAGLSPKAVQSAQVPYVDDKVLADFGDVIIPDTVKRAQLVKSMLISPARPQPSPNPGAVEAIAPAKVRVDVQNGTGISGMGKRVAELLKFKGFAIGQVGNAPTSDVAVTELHQHSQTPFAAIRVRDALGTVGRKATIVTDGTPAPLLSSLPSEAPSRSSDVTVVVGHDIAMLLGQQASVVP